ncbi:nitroreductase [Mycolicibacterium chubuense NBB4]|uniref:Nitroreductase n=1 Tax=Mycolicibacterium chubuense (strain NBB4) TaxID=710421 RepID=I4BIE5_MYCCN|nr:NAD(P)H nitroreductase [Mycolicibacterium chubuense]AFM17052.1 nitroreductase [Mycolicibacterium chubuense NBB4]
MPTTQVGLGVIINALQLACRAPSVLNSQPWRWIVTDDSVDLFADPARLVRSTDRTGRQALISCGAALHHLRVAMSAAGWDSTVSRFPDPDEPLHLARLTFSSAASVSEQQKRRADAILLRRTDRLPFAAPPDWDAFLDVVDAGAQPRGVRLSVLADEMRTELAEASQLTEALRHHDAAYHHEILLWTANFVTSDGIPHSALVSAAESGRVDVASAFPLATHPERRTEMADDHSMIVVLSTDDDSGESILRCGEALSALLLDATVAGLTTCTLTHVTEDPSGREVVASLIANDAIPQVLVRIGRAPALDATPPPTPRRPIEQVVEIRRSATC